MSISVPDNETRLVVISYRPDPKFLSETLGVLAPDAQGRQTLFVHTHLAQKGPLPLIEEIKDYESGETIRVSESWLGGNQAAALRAEQED